MRHNKEILYSSVVLALVVLYFWDSVYVLPLKLLPVLFHELSHGFAAIFTGGSIDHIQVHLNQGGQCGYCGGISWIVLSAGYLGSLAWGSGLLVANVKTRKSKELVTGLSIFLLVVVALWVREFESIMICLLLSSGLFIIAKHTPYYVNEISLNVISMISCFYTIYDIKDDLLVRSVSNSDANLLAKQLHLNGRLIGFVWLAISLIVIFYTFRYALGMDKKK